MPPRLVGRCLIGCAALGLIGCGDGDAGPDAAPSPWSAGPNLPGGRLEASVVALDDGLWVIGGFDDDLQVVTDTWVLDPAVGWHPGPAAPVPLTHMNVAVVDGDLYLLGGLVGSDFVPTGEGYALHPATGQWRSLAAMPSGQARGAAAVAVSGSRIVLAGGAAADSALDSVLVYDTATDSWSSLPDLPSPRSHAVGALAPDGAVLAIGGTATLDASQPLADVLALADGAGAWQTRAPMPTARGGCAAALVDGHLLCAGGEAGSAALRVTEAYDLAADTWTRLPDMPRGRAGTGGAAIDGRLWVPGGAHHLVFDPTADVESLGL